jgi:hypothetical protein
MLSPPPFLHPTEKPNKKSMFTVMVIILLRASINMTNNKEYNGSFCLKPRELLNNPYEDPFINTKKHTEEIQ